jgi:hypothetical protein
MSACHIWRLIAISEASFILSAIGTALILLRRGRR